MIEKYDQLYNSDLKKERFPEIKITKWPRNRFEAALPYILAGDRVLDVGCGNGIILYQVRNKFNEFLGLEFSLQRLQQAMINLDAVSFVPIRGSAEDMHAIADSSVDCIICIDTIEHIPDVYLATAEMFRVLKPGGIIVINTPNIAFIKKRLLLLLGRFPSTSQLNEGAGSDILFDGGHLHYFTFRSLSLVLSKAGFNITRRVGYGPFRIISNLIPTLLSSGVQLIAAKPEE